MTDPDQDALDARIQSYYGGEFDEAVRLTTRSAQGRLEHARTQELVRELVPPGSRDLPFGDAEFDAALLLGPGGPALRRPLPHR